MTFKRSAAIGITDATMSPAVNLELMPPLGWLDPVNPRISLPPPTAQGLVFRSLQWIGRLFGREAIPDLFVVLNMKPRLFWPWLFFASRLMPYGTLPARLREKVILRMAWNCRCRYEWGQHVDVGLQIGLTDIEIVGVSQSPPVVADRVEGAVLTACDEFHRDGFVGDATWSILREAYPEKQLVELLMLIGHYLMLGGFLNSSGVALEAPIEARLQAFYRRIGKT